MISRLILVIICARLTATGYAPSCIVHHDSPDFWTADCSSTLTGQTRLPEMLGGSLPIKRVILKYNRLNFNFSFNNLTSIQWIDLAYNNFKVIPNSMFNEFKELKCLNLSSNDLQSISEDYLVNSLYIESLDLSHNTWLSANKNFLNDLRKIVDRGVKTLRLRAINLKWLPEYFFTRSYELKNLDLRQNQLKELPSFPVSLVQLDISLNQFTKIGLTQFLDCTNLEILIAEKNPFLIEIRDDSFYYARRLKRVSFEGNFKLNEIPEALFRNNPLEYLSLADCGFKTLPPSFQDSFTQLNYIDLRNNPWICDRSIRWFLNLKTDVNDTRLRCNNTGDSFAEFYEPSIIDHGFLEGILIGLIFVIVLLFSLSIWIVYSTEFRKKVQKLYSPLDYPVNLSQSVYATTVRSINN